MRPLLHLHKISPTLYTYVQDLDEMEQLRNDFIIMKNFFVDCLVAKEQKLLQKVYCLSSSMHILSLAYYYSLISGHILKRTPSCSAFMIFIILLPET